MTTILHSIHKLTPYTKRSTEDSRFKVNGLTAGERVRLQMFATQGPIVTGYWKPSRDGTWKDISTNIQPIGIKTRVDIEMDEGGEFDEETFPA